MSAVTYYSLKSVVFVLTIFSYFHVFNAINNEGSLSFSGKISEEKCKEYSKLVKTCGHKEQELKNGGFLATVNEFPHSALLGFETNFGISWICAGSIVSDQYILTAAHCVQDIHGRYAVKYVKVGMTKLKNDNNSQQFKVLERIRHPEYVSRSFYSDIALLKLEKKIQLNSNIYPVCLNTKRIVSSIKAIATGFGRSTKDRPRRGTLMKTTLELTESSICENLFKEYKEKAFVDGIQLQGHFCAGPVGDVNHTYQPISGDPLLVYHSGDDVKCMYDLIGFAAYRKGEGDTPGLYGRISRFVQWIESVVWN